MNAVEVLRVRTARFMGLYIMAHLPLVVVLEWLVRGSVGWLSAVVELALEHPQHGPAFRDELRRILTD